MGWSGGTEIFDDIVDVVLREYDEDSIASLLSTKTIISETIKSLWNKDWDCECESKHIDNEIVRECLIQLDDTWKEYFDEIDGDV